MFTTHVERGTMLWGESIDRADMYSCSCPFHETTYLLPPHFVQKPSPLLHFRITFVTSLVCNQHAITSVYVTNVGLDHINARWKVNQVAIIPHAQNPAFSGPVNIRCNKIDRLYQWIALWCNTRSSSYFPIETTFRWKALRSNFVSSYIGHTGGRVVACRRSSVGIRLNRIPTTNVSSAWDGNDAGGERTHPIHSVHSVTCWDGKWMHHW
jgi:hypothetical protein